MTENDKSQLQEKSEHFDEAKKVAEAFYYQYVSDESSRSAIEAIAELIHYGDGNLELIRQRMALQ